MSHLIKLQELRISSQLSIPLQTTVSLGRRSMVFNKQTFHYLYRNRKLSGMRACTYGEDIDVKNNKVKSEGECH